MGNYIVVSLELNLFFLRIMKEHSLFLESGFLVKEESLIKRSQWFREQFEDLLEETTRISGGAVGQSVLDSHEIVTCYTKSAEEKTSRLTGIPIDSKITIAQTELQSGCGVRFSRPMQMAVKRINQRAFRLVRGLIELKADVLRAIRSCAIFAFQYPLLVEHILREARLYGSFLMELERRGTISRTCMRNTEIFWNQIMMEHAWFIRGLLDPCEKDLFAAADKLGEQFSCLLEEAKEKECAQIGVLTPRTIEQTKRIQEFKEAGTKGILKCEIQSMILPLLADHVLREANHYLRILQEGSERQQSRIFETENRRRQRENCEMENRGCARENCEMENRGCARENYEMEDRGCARENCEMENRGCARENCEMEDRGCARENCEMENRGCARESREMENRGCARENCEMEDRGCHIEVCETENAECQRETHKTEDEG